MYYLYILFSEKLNRFYVGQTNDLLSRLKRHNSGQENYTSKGVPWEIVYFVQLESRGKAMRMEKKLKNLKSQSRLKDFIDREISAGRGCRGIENL